MTTGLSGATPEAKSTPEPDLPEQPASDGTDGEEPAAKADDWLASLPSLSKNPLAGCQQCHVDVEEEFVGSTHFEEKTGCTDCHGPSEGHIADENNEVKPDEVFARQDVDRLCGECHECFRDEATDSPGKPQVCTECHGSHAVMVPVVAAGQ